MIIILINIIIKKTNADQVQYKDNLFRKIVL